MWSHFLVCSNYQVPYKSPCRKLWLIRLWQWSRQTWRPGFPCNLKSSGLLSEIYCRWSCSLPSLVKEEIHRKSALKCRFFDKWKIKGGLLACRRRELGSGRYSIIIKVGTYYSVRKEVGMNAENFLSNVTTLPFNSKAVQRFMMTSVLNIWYVLTFEW